MIATPTYAEARAAHIAAAEDTDRGRVKRPGGRIIGKIVPYWRPAFPTLLPRPERQALATYLAGFVPSAMLEQVRPRRMITDYRLIAETRQMRRAQDRKEDEQ